MSTKFILARVLVTPLSIDLNHMCDTGEPASGLTKLPSDTTYPDGSPMLDGQICTFCLSADGSVLPGIYPWGDPIGDPARYGGGGGRGHIVGGMQRESNAPVFAQSADGGSPVIDDRFISVSSINGIIMSTTITNVTDPNFYSLPLGTQINFQGLIGPDGDWSAHIVEQSLGDCDAP